MKTFMEKALVLGRLAGERDEVPVGAVLICGGEVLGQGMNDRESSGRAVAHAEIEALDDYSARTGQWRLPPETTLVVTVEPCLMCTGAALWARVDHIVYGCSDPKRAGLLTLKPLIDAGTFDHRFKSVVGGCEEEACAELMRSFFRRKRESKINEADPCAVNRLIAADGILSTRD